MEKTSPEQKDKLLPTPEAKAGEAAPVEKQAENPTAKPGKRRKSFGEKNFDLLTYWGVGWLVNCTLSLYTAYNLLPTKPVQKMIKGFGDGMSNVFTGSARMVSQDSQFIKYAGEKARSFAEICCMFIAGCAVLVPMKMLENRKESIVNWLNRKWYKGEVPEGETDPLMIAACKGEYKPRIDDTQTWSNLLKARVTAMVGIIGVDQAIEAFNNSRFDKGKANLDTMEWKAGSRFYDRISKPVRETFINFFDRHGATAESIQPMIRERLIKTVGSDPKRMVFAEQSRLFLKEFILTWILAGMLYTASVMGLRKKAAQAQQNGADTLDEPVVPMIPDAEELLEERKNTPARSFASSSQRSNGNGHSPRIHAKPEPTAHFTDYAQKSVEAEPQVGV